MKKIKLAKFDTEVTLSAKKDGAQVIQGIANSLTMTRSGIRVTEDAGKSLVGKVVPLMQSHDWTKPSIGRATMTSVDGKGLHYEATLYDDAPLRNLLLQGIEGGTNYVSIGFGTDNIDPDGSIDSVDLLELSLTSIPADPKATSEIIKQAIEGDDDEEPKDTPTIQDVLDAINKLSTLVEEEHEGGDGENDDNNSEDNNTVETEALKAEIEEYKGYLQSVQPILSRMGTHALSYNEKQATRRITKLDLQK